VVAHNFGAVRPTQTSFAAQTATSPQPSANRPTRNARNAILHSVLLLQHESAGVRTAIRLTPPCYTAEKPSFLDAH
jgi:hypothetical protein